MKKIPAILFTVLAVLALAGCSSPADVASQNVSREADQFHVLRRITVINGITDKYLMEIVGYCSLGNNDPQYDLSVTCKVSDENGGQFKKMFVHLSDNVTVLTEQIDAIGVSTNHYEVIFQPTTIVPDVVIP